MRPSSVPSAHSNNFPVSVRDESADDSATASSGDLTPKEIVIGSHVFYELPAESTVPAAVVDATRTHGAKRKRDPNEDTVFKRPSGPASRPDETGRNPVGLSAVQLQIHRQLDQLAVRQEVAAIRQRLSTIQVQLTALQTARGQLVAPIVEPFLSFVSGPMVGVGPADLLERIANLDGNLRSLEENLNWTEFVPQEAMERIRQRLAQAPSPVPRTSIIQNQKIV